MAITNNNLPVIDLPDWLSLQPYPAASAAGVSMCNDYRGTNRFIYLMISATSFWRYDTYANTYQQLANPPGGTVGAGTVLMFDPSQGAAGYIWALISNGTATPTWQYYNCATNTWTARSVTNLPATFGTDGALSHTCSTYNVAGNDDYIYLVGNNATAVYRYSITGNSWSTMTAATGASGAGCSLRWMPGWNTDRIVRIRGGATAVIDHYNIAANTWTTPFVFQPATETFTTGTMVTARGVATDKLFIQKDNTMRIYELDLGDATLIPVATQYLIAAGTAIAGDRMLYVTETNGIAFIYLGVHTSASFLRTALIV